MLSDKQSINLLALMVLLPAIGLVSIPANLFLEKRCLDYGKKQNIETRERFFNGCQFKNSKGDWKSIKEYRPLPDLKFSTVYP